MALWLDYSFGRPAISEMKAKGVTGVLRYLSPDDPNTHGKILFAPERDALLSAGLDIVLNFEWYAGRCVEGATAGAQDAAHAVAQAKALGYPAGAVIIYSNDQSIFNQSVIDYFTAVRQNNGGYRVGAYGSYETVTKLHQLGLIDVGWQTLAWSAGQRDPWSLIYQDGNQLFGGSADEDIVSGSLPSWRNPGVSTTSASERPLTTQVTKDGYEVLDPNDPVILKLQENLNHAFGLLLYGDSKDAAYGKAPQSHHFNLFEIKQELDQVKAELAALKVAAGDPKAIAREIGAALQRGEQ